MRTENEGKQDQKGVMKEDTVREETEKTEEKRKSIRESM